MKRAIFEQIETRLHLCVLHTSGLSAATLPEAYRIFDGLPRSSDGHIARSSFVRAHPEYQGANLWDPKVFNRKNSDSPKKWKFDPHLIEDDRPASQQIPPAPKVTVRAAAVSAVQDVLPDFAPKLSGTPYMDRTQIAGRALVRFGTQVNNQGLGPGILVGGPTNSNGTQTVYQRVYKWDPTTNALSASYDRVAGNFTYHPTHGHLHFDGYAKYRLLSNVNGSPGSVVMRPDGQPAESAKVGFCLINVNSSFTLPSGQSSTTLSTYSASGMPSTSCGQFQGVNPGRADVYSASLADQWIDVTGVPDGNYFVEITLDANNGMLESNEANNTATFAISVTGNGAGPILADRFEPNDTLATAKTLGATGSSTVSGLTVHTGGNSDFFSFTATSTVTSAPVSIYFTDGDLDLRLYNSAGTLLNSATTTGTGSVTTPRTETITRSFTEGATYVLQVSGKTSSTTSRAYEIRFGIPPKLTMAVPDASASEAGDRGTFSVTRNGPALGALTVNFALSGTATRGVDYNVFLDGNLISGNSFVMGAEAQTSPLEIVPISDSLTEGSESIVLSLATSSAYVIGSPSSGTMTLLDQTALPLPTVPANLGATFVAGSGVRLNWNDSTNESGFEIEWRYSNWVWTPLTNPPANTITYLDTAAALNTSLEYRIRAVNGTGPSNWSNIALVNTTASTGTPGAASNLTGSAPSRWQVQLNWTDNATNESGYRVRRRVAGTATWTDLGEILPANSTSYSDWSVWSASPGTQFEYVVVAVNSSGESPLSNAVTVTLPSA